MTDTIDAGREGEAIERRCIECGMPVHGMLHNCIEALKAEAARLKSNIAHAERPSAEAPVSGAEALALTANEKSAVEAYRNGNQMYAYYYEFKPTGDPGIDSILSAVAIAGKGYHHTEMWAERNNGDDFSFIDLIQGRAKLAAARSALSTGSPNADGGAVADALEALTAFAVHDGLCEMCRQRDGHASDCTIARLAPLSPAQGSPNATERSGADALLTADCTYQAKLLIRLRDKLINIKDEIEDEGDRAYFGSTNDADQFKEIVGLLDDFKWSRIIDRSKGRDIYGEMRELREELAAVKRERDALSERSGAAEKALSRIADAIPHLKAQSAERSFDEDENGATANATADMKEIDSIVEAFGAYVETLPKPKPLVEIEDVAF